MTIDEAIEHAREKAKEQRYYANFERNGMMYQSCIKCAEEHEQLAEWLEELKAMRNLDKTNFSDGYNRGIDDFLRKSDGVIPYTYSGNKIIKRLEKIADELKGGRDETKL